MERQWHRVGRVDEVRTGAVRRVQIDGVRWVGLHVFQDRIYALDDACPHWGIPLTRGCINAYGQIECELHGWTYELATGRGVVPAGTAIERFDVEEREGEIFVAAALEVNDAASRSLSGSGL